MMKRNQADLKIITENFSSLFSCHSLQWHWVCSCRMIWLQLMPRKDLMLCG